MYDEWEEEGKIWQGLGLQIAENCSVQILTYCVRSESLF